MSSALYIAADDTEEAEREYKLTHCTMLSRLTIELFTHIISPIHRGPGLAEVKFSSTWP